MALPAWIKKLLLGAFIAWAALNFWNAVILSSAPTRLGLRISKSFLKLAAEGTKVQNDMQDTFEAIDVLEEVWAGNHDCQALLKDLKTDFTAYNISIGDLIERSMAVHQAALELDTVHGFEEKKRLQHDLGRKLRELYSHCDNTDPTVDSI